ncbi:MAG: UDP-N-acetylglucosamine 2-epimerase (non-hydrolyzing) [Candidatus Marinimicrobia bacterium]|jgi:UDP-GlcNAc3NAcA epimerase|nr:UDP-N-acetylglucosamine 2-epimerase (non-hydrolyzing) [Candidatus Neomarinimicrobiota bacterium]
MKIATIIGARPQFIKSATISRIFRNYNDINEIIIHTGQHYDENMSEIFFNELKIPKPNYNLEVGSESHGKQTAMMLEKIEAILLKEKPDWVLVYGDTNSTIAGALAATKLHIKIAHVEAGLRSFNRKMPEEINRIATDHISDILFVPTQNAMNLLANEGIVERAVLVGDVMYDAILYNQKLADEKYKLSDLTNLNNFYLGTIHRPANTDNLVRLQNIFSAFSELDLPIILPLHPRTQKIIKKIKYSKNVKIIEPVSYLKMIVLLKNCEKVLTDSGGLQKEAYYLHKPCITMRDETEWIETLENNWNFIVGADKDQILEKVKNKEFGEQKDYFGDGKAAEKIVDFIYK